MAADGSPARHEIAQELQLLRASRTFSRHRKLLDFLQVIVDAEIDGEPPTEHELGVKVFGKPPEWNPYNETVVRENTRRLRKLLEEYFLEEGHNDLVVIEVTKGSGRRPRFFYNPHQNAGRLHKRIVEDMNKTFPEMRHELSFGVIRELRSCIKQHPGYAPAYATLAEVLLTYAALDDPFSYPPRQCVQEAQEAIDTCLRLNDQFWLAHVMSAALQCCRFEWVSAGQSFDRALSLDSDKTKEYFWYRAYLIAMGDASSVEKWYVWIWHIRPPFRIQSAFNSLFQYVSRQRSKAYDNLSRHCTTMDHFRTIVSPERDREYPSSCDNWLIGVLMTCAELALDEGGTPIRHAQQFLGDSQTGAFNGLLVCSHERQARYSDVPKEDSGPFIQWMEANHEWHSDVSFALAYMAVGDTDKAIAKLRAACDDTNPLMMWLHLWPILDPLREHQGFRSLVSRMGLPESVLAAASARIVENKQQEREEKHRIDRMVRDADNY